jgi:hypothetical protein
MRTLWGPFTEINDLGVVAEQCPQCERITPCLLRSTSRGDYVFFLKSTKFSRENSCLCTVCLKAFHCDYWRYAMVIKIKEAKALSIEELLTLTNPILAELNQMKEQIVGLGGDARFADAYQQLGGMRPGQWRSKQLQQLLNWNVLTEEARVELIQRIGAHARAWQLARQIAPSFPTQAGCLISVVTMLVVGSTTLLLPVNRILMVVVTMVSGVLAMTVTNHLLMTPRVRRWTRTLLIREADEANVPLTCFLEVVKDVSDSRLNIAEPLWVVNGQLETIRAVLVAERKL